MLLSSPHLYYDNHYNDNDGDNVNDYDINDEDNYNDKNFNNNDKKYNDDMIITMRMIMIVIVIIVTIIILGGLCGFIVCFHFFVISLFSLIIDPLDCLCIFV